MESVRCTKQCLLLPEGEDTLEASGRLFLRNLPFTSTEAELSDAFAEFGDLQEVHLVLDRYLYLNHHCTCSNLALETCRRFTLCLTGIPIVIIIVHCPNLPRELCC